ncbi:hypothetical protein B0H10DRAFT_1007815 [Mycena sp. CBHHK59/15]|nr:hypothetical protein B0H10DRAFT_1007815 [Mycena sp. CBHHK59/15]
MKQSWLPIRSSFMPFPPSLLSPRTRLLSPLRFWQRLDFTKGSGSDGVSNNGGPNPRGGTLVSQGVNTTGRYIEDQQGEVVDGHRLSAICKLAARIWVLHNSGLRASSCHCFPGHSHRHLLPTNEAICAYSIHKFPLHSVEDPQTNPHWPRAVPRGCGALQKAARRGRKVP